MAKDFCQELSLNTSGLPLQYPRVRRIRLFLRCSKAVLLGFFSAVFTSQLRDWMYAATSGTCY